MGNGAALRLPDTSELVKTARFGKALANRNKPSGASSNEKATGANLSSKSQETNSPHDTDKVSLSKQAMAFDDTVERKPDELLKKSDLNPTKRNNQPAETVPSKNSKLEDDSLIGKDLSGRWRIQEKLGEGGMGLVYKAMDMQSETPVAVKVVRPQLSFMPELGKMLLDEANMLRQASGSRNVLRFIDAGIDSGVVFLTTEYLQGKTVKALMNDGTISIPDAMQLIRSVCIGLDEGVHSKGNIHSDIKPDNIMVTGNNEAKLLDFGVAQPVKNSESMDGIIRGTPRFMSPEQSVGGPLGPSSDIFSLGVSFYQMTTENTPYPERPGSSLPNFSAKLRPEVFSFFPPIVRDTVLPTMLHVNPDLRYQSTPQLMRDIDTYIRYEENSYQSFKGAIENGVQEVRNGSAKKAGAVVYFKNSRIEAGFEGAVKAAFPEREGYVVFRSDRKGMEGIFIYGKTGKNALKRKAQQFMQANRAITTTNPVTKRIDSKGSETVETIFRRNIQALMVKSKQSGVEPIQITQAEEEILERGKPVIKENLGKIILQKGDLRIVVDLGGLKITRKDGKLYIGSRHFPYEGFKREIGFEQLSKQNPYSSVTIDGIEVRVGVHVRMKGVYRAILKPLEGGIGFVPGQLREVIPKAVNIIKEAVTTPRTVKVILTYLKSPEGRALLASEKGKQFINELQAMAQAKTTGQALKLEGGGLLAGLAVLIGAEKLADLLGINNKQARFVFVLGLSHVANLETQKLLQTTVLGRQAAQAAKVLGNLSTYGKIMGQLKGILGGFTQMAFTSIITNGIMDIVGVKNQVLREKINLGTSFVAPAVARFGYGRLAAKVGETALSRTGVGIASKILGRAAIGLGAANAILDMGYGLIASDYRIKVNNEAYEKAMVKRAGGGVFSKAGVLLSSFVHPIGGSGHSAAVAADNPAIRRAVVLKDINDAKMTRSELKAGLLEYLRNGGDLSLLTRENKLSSSEEAVFNYIFEQVKKHPSVQFGGEEHLKAVSGRFKMSSKEIGRIFEKGVMISWQSQLAFLHMVQPSIFDGFESERLNDDIRNTCTSKGVLKREKIDAFKARFLGIK